MNIDMKQKVRYTFGSLSISVSLLLELTRNFSINFLLVVKQFILNIITSVKLLLAKFIQFLIVICTGLVYDIFLLSIILILLISNILFSCLSLEILSNALFMEVIILPLLFLITGIFYGFLIFFILTKHELLRFIAIFFLYCFFIYYCYISFNFLYTQIFLSIPNEDSTIYSNACIVIYNHNWSNDQLSAFLEKLLAEWDLSVAEDLKAKWLNMVKLPAELVGLVKAHAAALKALNADGGSTLCYLFAKVKLFLTNPYVICGSVVLITGGIFYFYVPLSTFVLPVAQNFITDSVDKWFLTGGNVIVKDVAGRLGDLFQVRASYGDVLTFDIILRDHWFESQDTILTHLYSAYINSGWFSTYGLAESVVKPVIVQCLVENDKCFDAVWKILFKRFMP